MELGWQAVVQAVIVAACTWYIRRGNKRDSQDLKRVAQAESGTMREILDRLKAVELDLALIKRVTLKDNSGDQPTNIKRGPDRGPRLT